MNFISLVHSDKFLWYLLIILNIILWETSPRNFNFKDLKIKRTFIVYVLSLLFATSVFAKDIIDTAVANGNFKTLATALTEAGLIDTLKGPGPFTVFAPTDEAFAKIPQADLEALLKDKEKLSAVLTYHVVAGKVMAKDVKTGKVKTVQGSELSLSVNSTKKSYGKKVVTVKVDNATVIIADVVADNGVIHLIDTVVVPK